MYEKDDTILSKGQTNEELYILRHGQVDARAAFDGRCLFPLAAAGAFFGETTLMGITSQLTYVAGNTHSATGT